MKFADACTHTGGTPDCHYCTCDGKKQKEYETCTSPQSPDCDKCCESCGNCGGETCNFEDACKASGGDAAGGICVCNGVGCKKGVICNFDENESGEHLCADECLSDMCDFSKPVIGVNCSSDDSRCFATCENSNSVGKLLVCDSSKYVETVCKNDKNEEVSCKNDHSCGTCKNYTQLCENQINEAGEEIGAVIECQEGQPGKATALCKDVSCRTDIPACGECINGKLKCTEDTNNNAIMYRCVDGKWKRIENKLDPIDPGYACPSVCTMEVTGEYREYECKASMCDNCDPCWGTPEKAYYDYNPCYNKEKCEQILKAEDKDYPPFRDYATSVSLNDKRAMKTVHGYNFNNHGDNINDRVEDFDLDLTNGTGRVSCNADGTYYGVCHNSLQICINTKYHQEGYIVQCARGQLSDYDNNGDGIACSCEKTEHNSMGCCYTRRNCFKNTSATSGMELCEKPGKTEGYAEDNDDYKD